MTVSVNSNPRLVPDGIKSSGSSARMVTMLPLPPTARERLESLGWTCVAPTDAADAVAHLATADACLGSLTPDLLAAAPRLQWLQANSAGLDNFWFPELRASSVTITNLRGIYSDFIADHVMAFVLTFSRGLHRYSRQQAAAHWEASATVTHLPDSTLLIIGLGGIGCEVAKRAQIFGLRVVAIDPHPRGNPSGVDAIHPPTALKEVLPAADFVVITVPHTPQTEFMIDATTLACMKRSAVLINVGRGKVVRLQDLVTALLDGTLGGAALDVFEQEPLPPDHPLWAMENVMITPHCAYQSDAAEGRRADLIVENARRFLHNEPLLNVVDKHYGYVV